jgi:hypothetical protein
MNYSKEQPKKTYAYSPYQYVNILVREMALSEIQALWEQEHPQEQQEITEEFINEHKYCYEQVKIPMGRWNYENAVDALITHKYPNDKMQAVINNYLLDPTDTDALAEFNAMQEYRKYCKELAKQLTRTKE